MQLGHSVCDCSKLLGCWLQAIDISTRKGRPRFCCRSDPLAGQHQHGRVKTPELLMDIVNRLATVESISLSDSRQHRSFRSFGRNCTRTKENDILRQPLRDRMLPFCQGDVLLKNAGRSALGIDITVKQAQGHAFKIGGAHHPERLLFGRMRGSRQTQTDCLQASGGFFVAILHQT